MSAVITKSWPRINGEVVVTLDEVLKHLLFWPDIKHVLKLFGMFMGVCWENLLCPLGVLLPPGEGALFDLIPRKG